MSGIIKAGTQQLYSSENAVEFNLHDFSDRANQYLQQVRQQAAQVLQQAKTEAEKIRKQAELSGRQAAKQAAEGLKLFENIPDWNEDLETSGIHKDLSRFPMYEKANR